MLRSAFVILAAVLALGGCSRTASERANTLPDSAAAAIAMDRPERPIVPLAGGDTIRLERVTLGRSNLDLSAPPTPVVVTPAVLSPEPPVPEPGEPPAPSSTEPWSPDPRKLLPPIPRGVPATAIGGKGGHVTLDVRVDEQGDVSDALLVESDADSLTVHAAISAAEAVRYHPALLDGRPIAVWTRQVIEIQKPRR